MTISVSPSESGRQLTATHDGVAQIRSKSHISGNSLMAGSRMYKREFNTRLLTAIRFIVSAFLCVSNRPGSGCKTDNADTIGSLDLADSI